MLWRTLTRNNKVGNKKSCRGSGGDFTWAGLSEEVTFELTNEEPELGGEVTVPGGVRFSEACGL